MKIWSLEFFLRFSGSVLLPRCINFLNLHNLEKSVVIIYDNVQKAVPLPRHNFVKLNTFYKKKENLWNETRVKCPSTTYFKRGAWCLSRESTIWWQLWKFVCFVLFNYIFTFERNWEMEIAVSRFDSCIMG